MILIDIQDTATPALQHAISRLVDRSSLNRFMAM